MDHREGQHSMINTCSFTCASLAARVQVKPGSSRDLQLASTCFMS